MGGHSQTGIIAGASISEYNQNLIKIERNAEGKLITTKCFIEKNYNDELCKYLNRKSNLKSEYTWISYNNKKLLK